MESIIENLMKQVATGNNLSSIAKSVGGDEKGVQSALSMGLPLLMGSMANTASKPGGADTLMTMLTQTGSSNPLDNLGSLLGNPAASGGAGMVNTLLGNQTSAIQNSISQKSGLTSSVVGKLLAIAAPMVIGSVAKMFTGQKMDQKGLSSLLGEQSKMVMQSSPEAANMAKQFLEPKEKSSGIMDRLKKLFGG
jgi:hypothetical protein